MHRVLVACMVVAILVGGAGISAGFDAGSSVDRLATSPGATAFDGSTYHQQDPASFDYVTFRVTVHDDGSARWTFHYTRVLDNETAVQEFETFADRFVTDETQFYTHFTQQAEALAASGSNETGRSMTAGEFSRDARLASGTVSNELGIVEVSFLWTGFAETDGDRIVVGDVFAGGLYLDAQQSLEITAGEGLRFDRVDPPPDRTSDENVTASQTVSWDGEELFADGATPYAVLVPLDIDDPSVSPADSGAGDGNDGSTGTDGADGGDGSNGVDDPVDEQPWPIVAGGLVVLGLVGAAAWWRVKTRDVPGRPVEGTDGSSADPVALSEEDLLSDEDRVVSLLERNGGRMKQVAIVRETDWSKSKVSMLLSEMEDEGTISKLRVGRENIVSLAGHEPAATRSSLDTEEE